MANTARFFLYMQSGTKCSGVLTTEILEYFKCSAFGQPYIYRQFKIGAVLASVCYKPLPKKNYKGFRFKIYLRRGNDRWQTKDLV